MLKPNSKKRSSSNRHSVDTLAKKYDRYYLLSQNNVSNTRCDPDGMHCCVLRELRGLRLYTAEPMVEEMAI